MTLEEYSDLLERAYCFFDELSFEPSNSADIWDFMQIAVPLEKKLSEVDMSPISSADIRREKKRLGPAWSRVAKDYISDFEGVKYHAICAEVSLTANGSANNLSWIFIQPVSLITNAISSIVSRVVNELEASIKSD